MYAIRSYYGKMLPFGNHPADDAQRERALRVDPVVAGQDDVLGRVITSYSIHYTKLYDHADRVTDELVGLDRRWNRDQRARQNHACEHIPSSGVECVK